MSDVLVADARRSDRDRAAAALRLGGFRVRSARTLTEAGSMLRRRSLSAVIVDPVADEPASVVAELRARTELPIIVVSERREEWEIVAALDAGADDYLTKPYGAEELLARLRAALRRVPRGRDDRPLATPDFTLDLADRRLVRSGGGEVHLTPVEWRIVEVLARRAGHLVSQEDVLRAVWGPQALDKPGYLRVNMAHIRAKIEPEPSRPRYFLTAPGLGMRFDPTGGRP